MAIHAVRSGRTQGLRDDCRRAELPPKMGEVACTAVGSMIVVPEGGDKGKRAEKWARQNGDILTGLDVDVVKTAEEVGALLGRLLAPWRGEPPVAAELFDERAGSVPASLFKQAPQNFAGPGQVGLPGPVVMQANEGGFICEFL